MKKYFSNCGYITLTLIASFLLAPISFAKTINLYDQPKNDSKVIATLDSDAGIITIFTPKEGGWVKVADPRNGNVGWIKATDMGATGVNFTVMSTGNGGHGYQVIQYSGTQPYTPQQIQLKQEEFQKEMQRMMQMQDVFRNGFYPFPVIMPVVIVPENKTNAKSK